MTPALDFSSTDKSIGLITRPAKNGPETDLINEFIECELPRLKGLKKHYALFCEPQLDTGFPDIVIASYNPRIYESWKSERFLLTVSDIKLLHHLHFLKGADSECIEQKLGSNNKTLVQSLERLLDAELIRWYGKRWMPRKLEGAYGVKNLIAIEAKIKNWKEALNQAELNKWFASESYILSPVETPQEHILSKSQNLGVGIFSMPKGKRSKRVLKPEKAGLPTSYASWLFNEWIGRRINL